MLRHFGERAVARFLRFYQTLWGEGCSTFGILATDLWREPLRRHLESVSSAPVVVGLVGQGWVPLGNRAQDRDLESQCSAAWEPPCNCRGCEQRVSMRFSLTGGGTHRRKGPTARDPASRSAGPPEEAKKHKAASELRDWGRRRRWTACNEAAPMGVKNITDGGSQGTAAGGPMHMPHGKRTVLMS